MTFKNWFKAQYGPRPGGTDTTPKIRERMIKISVELVMIERKYAARKLWDEKYDTALKSWQAREKENAR